MTLTTAEQVRGRIQDLPQIVDLTQYGDGQSSAFWVGGGTLRNLTSASAFVPDASGRWSATGASVDPSGFVTFATVLPAHSAYRVRGVYSVFSEAEIGHFTAVGGSVAGAALEAVRWLRFDALRRARWAAPDGSEYDDTAAITALERLQADLQQECAPDDSAGLGFESWALGQDEAW
jgi:hypothetical protein